jgi:16S rRNA (guanine527-N7)-methyltransferase
LFYRNIFSLFYLKRVPQKTREEFKNRLKQAEKPTIKIIMSENEALFNEFQSYVAENIISFFTKEMSEKFKKYFREIREWNNMFNLISFKDGKDLIYRHFCDCLHSAKAIKDITDSDSFFSSSLFLNIADIGTGSGMPGIPVKITLPNVRLTLVESVTKKCSFLENVNNKLKLDTEILNKRAEEIGQNSKYRQQYDFVLSRAVSKFSPNLEISIPLLKTGGYFIVHKTKKSIESSERGLSSTENALKHLGASFERTVSYKLPQQNIGYCILTFKKYKNTPAKFPRKPGIPEKRPL